MKTKLTLLLVCAMTAAMSLRAFAAEEPCDPDDIASPCYNWLGDHLPLEDPQVPGPDVGSGPGSPAPCDPFDIWGDCWDPSLGPKPNPQVPGRDVGPEPVDYTSPEYQSRHPGQAATMPDWLKAATDLGAEVLKQAAKGAASGATGGGSGSGGGGNDGAGSGENGTTDNKMLLAVVGLGAVMLLGSK